MFDWNNDEHDRMADTTTTLPIPRQRFSSTRLIGTWARMKDHQAKVLKCLVMKCGTVIGCLLE